MCSTAVASNGIRFGCTQTALFVITKCGVRALLAGHRTEGSFKDGQGSEARFQCPHGMAVDGNDNLLMCPTSTTMPCARSRSVAPSRRSQAMGSRALQTGLVPLRASIIRGA